MKLKIFGREKVKIIYAKMVKIEILIFRNAIFRYN